MLRFLADEDFNRAIVRGVLRVKPKIDIVRVQDVGLGTLEDSIVLNWAARERHIVLTHDAKTMPSHAAARILESLAMPGVFVVRQEEAISRTIQDIILLAEASLKDEWENRILYLPL